MKIQSLLLKTLNKAKAKKTKVSSVLVTRCGHIYEGCNIESSSPALSVCAERSAIINTIIHLGPDFIIDKILVLAMKNGELEHIYSCGACLQCISEFSDSETRVQNELLINLYPLQYK